VIRSGSPIKVAVISGSRVDDPATADDESKIPYVGIGVDTYYQASFDISFGVEGVGGPSAGTMFAIGIIDKLTPGALTDGKTIAGTGTIDPAGNVGEIGGIAQKLIGANAEGAELFLAPQSNCKDVVGHIPSGLTVVPVTTLTEAMQAISDYKGGKKLAACTDTK
jgi:PDZ domain-containing protein